LCLFKGYGEYAKRMKRDIKKGESKEECKLLCSFRSSL